MDSRGKREIILSCSIAFSDRRTQSSFCRERERDPPGGKRIRKKLFCGHDGREDVSSRSETSNIHSLINISCCVQNFSAAPYFLAAPVQRTT